MCIQKDGDQITPLTSDDVKTIEDSIVQFAKKGMRVLGFASKEINDNDKKYEEVKEAIQTAKDGGIRVIMITGDHKITAQEIATRLGIYDSEVYNQVITGYDIDTLPREEFEERIKHTNVFARVNPEHKAIIVELLQKQIML
ncbi:hypothetical protein FQA39_LY12980 [Lamprigera yunnana]|nr:hypothetical protein FQA39_LY12980 [Lamprigera yunnana]